MCFLSQFSQIFKLFWFIRRIWQACFLVVAIFTQSKLNTCFLHIDIRLNEIIGKWRHILEDFFNIILRESATSDKILSNCVTDEWLSLDLIGHFLAASSLALESLLFFFFGESFLDCE